MPDKPKTLIIDVGLDTEVEELKQVDIRVLNDSGPWTAKLHGTAVVGVYVHTLKGALETYYNKKIALRDYIDIDFYDASGNYHEDQVPSESDFHDIESYNKCMQEDINAVYDIVDNHHKYNSINMSFGMGPASEFSLRDHFKALAYNNTFVVVAAGNSKIFTTNDFLPNSAYSCTVGAYYPKGQIIPADATFLGIGEWSTPGCSVWFSIHGSHITYNTVSSLAYFSEDGVVSLCGGKEETEKNHPNLTPEQWDYVLEAYRKGLDELIALGHLPGRSEDIYASGTSFAAPCVTALKDFIKIVRPELDLRNIERLLLEATVPIDVSTLMDGWGNKSHIMRGEQRNNAETWNGVIGKPYYYEFGFGRLDEQRLIHLTKTWVAAKIEEVEFSLEKPTIEYQEKGQYVYVYDSPQDYRVFNVTLTYASSVSRSELESLSITSPAGTKDFIYYPEHSPKSFQQKWRDLSEEKLLESADENYITGFGMVNAVIYNQCPINNHATTIHFNGEGSKDKWTIRSNVPLEKKILTFRAEKWRINNVYRYDDGILNIENPRKLEDKNGGDNDVLDVSFYRAGDVHVNLQENGEKPRGITFMASGGKQKFVPIGEGTFERVLLAERK